jgi:hypothetical protein
MTRTVVWYSCGAASAIAAKMTLVDTPDAVITYCATRSEHPDNERFMQDCQRWFNRGITRLSSLEYQDTWHVWEARKYLAGIHGAPCTTALKVEPRLIWQQPTDIHVFGYTADKRDVTRAEELRTNYPEMQIRTPLIDAKVTKANTLAMIEGAGIDLPVMYKLGFHNNNCIPCVKATSPDYWSLVRQAFPDEFQRMAALSRKLNVRLTRIKGERKFIDEIPPDWPTTNPIAPACDFLCGAVALDFEPYDAEAAE